MLKCKGTKSILWKIRWCNRMICRLAYFAKPLHAAVHREPFTWTEEESIAHSSGTTPELVKGISRFCRHDEHCNR